MTQVVLALDIGGTNLKSGLIDAAGHVRRRETVPSEAGAGKEALLAVMDRLIGTYRQSAAAGGLTIAAIGIGTAGYVDRNGRVAYATEAIPGWSGFDLKGYAESVYRLPAAVANDAAAIAAGEAWRGAGNAFDRFLCVALGTGIGGCLWTSGAAAGVREEPVGPIGHQVIEHGGIACTCGQRGCWEQYASVGALKRMIADVDARRTSGKRLETPPQLFALARAGDAEAASLLNEYEDYVATGLVNLIYSLKVSNLVIAGAISQQGAFFTEGIRRRILDRLIPASAARPLRVVPARLGDDAGIMGAARSALQHIQ